MKQFFILIAVLFVAFAVFEFCRILNGSDDDYMMIEVLLDGGGSVLMACPERKYRSRGCYLHNGD